MCAPVAGIDTAGHTVNAINHFVPLHFISSDSLVVRCRPICCILSPTRRYLVYYPHAASLIL
jgi:hypothetical protein